MVAVLRKRLSAGPSSRKRGRIRDRDSLSCRWTNQREFLYFGNWTTPHQKSFWMTWRTKSRRGTCRRVVPRKPFPKRDIRPESPMARHECFTVFDEFHIWLQLASSGALREAGVPALPSRPATQDAEEVARYRYACRFPFPSLPDEVAPPIMMPRTA